MKPSRKQEGDLARLLAGKPTPASGAFWHRKGDVRNDQFLIEAKQTDKASIGIKKQVWEKIRREALLDGRIPAMALRIQDRDLIVLDLEDFLAAFPGPQTDMGEGGVP